MDRQTIRRGPAMLLALFVAWGAIGAVRLDAQATLAEIQKVDYLLTASKYTATRVNNPNVAVWTIARRGDAIGDFKLIVTADKGLVVAFVTVAAKGNIRRTPDLVERILQINHDLDYVKVGFDEDGDIFVRIDSSLRILDVDAINTVLAQVGNSADATYARIKPFLIR